jgi:pyruvate/2-oxoacid:ferredoxin oxidoreductase beta subunit
MGFQKPNLAEARQAIGKCFVEIHSPYNDGWIQSSCKHELYMLKCWLEIEYNKLPTFAGEEQWEQNRILEILKK